MTFSAIVGTERNFLSLSKCSVKATKLFPCYEHCSREQSLSIINEFEHDLNKYLGVGLCKRVIRQTAERHRVVENGASKRRSR